MTGETFHNQLKTQYDAIPSDRFREMGWKRYLELGLPTKKSEVYRYVKLRSLFAIQPQESAQSVTYEKIAPYILDECQNSCLVFVNGRYDLALSKKEALPSKVTVLELKDAIKTFGALLANHLTRALGNETDPFAALNTALQESGAFVYLPPQTKVEAPIQILNIATNSLSSPRLQCFVGAHSELTLVSSHGTLEDIPCGINHVNDIHCEEGAKVRLYQTTFGEMKRGWHLEATRATLKKEANLESIKMTLGSQTTRYDYKIHLLGENCEASLNSLNLLREKQQAHDNVWIHHHVPSCQSNQLFKSVLFDHGHSSFEGKIYVEREAQQTRAYQLNANLLLSDHARAESKPNLEIFADDVRASHGATFGQLEEEQVFYLKTRGLSDQTAKRMLIAGFSDEVLEKVSLSSLKTHYTSRL